MKLYPIISFNLDNSPYRAEDLSKLYRDLIEHLYAWTCQEDRIDYVNTIEFSLHNPGLIENLFAIHIELEMNSLDLAFGSLVSLDQVLMLQQNIRTIVPNQDINPYKVFAPAFDPEIYKMIYSHETGRFIDYIPGIACEDDLDELPFAANELNTIKIFPVSAKSPKSFLKLLQGPYPELRSEKFGSRVIALSDEMASEYDVYSKYQKNKDVVLVSTPREYQKIRNEFMLKPNMKLLLKPKEVDIQALIEEAKQDFPRAEVVLAGLGGDLDNVKNYKRVNAIATKMFKTIIFDILSGAISSKEAEALIADEFSKYSLIRA